MWPTYKGDFLPYNAAPLPEEEVDESYAYVSGIYSSRPNLKKQIRDFSSIAQSSLTLYAFDLLKTKSIPPTDSSVRDGPLKY